MFEKLTERGYQVEFHSHALAILSHDFPEAVEELEASLLDLEIPIAEIVGSGGGEAKATQRLRRSLAARAWTKVNFKIEKTINGQPRESISHEVDHVRIVENSGTIALEIEWNNKDPFFDRDLENFKRLHAEGAISVGVIVTRGRDLQDSLKELIARFGEEQGFRSVEDLKNYGLKPTDRQAVAITSASQRGASPPPFSQVWAHHFVADKFGAATTHWRKLEDRVHRGVGNPCPLLLIGLPASVVTFEEQPPED